MKLWLNDAFTAQFAALQRGLPHAIVLSGSLGVGLSTIAGELGGNSISHRIEPRNAKDEIDHTSGSIKVEAIRDLYDQTMGKSVKQVVIIDDADMMTRQAQNAFLKLLEEPHSGLHFILTTHHYDQLLATIRSRAQNYTVARLDEVHDNELITTFGLGASKAKALFIASGLPAELARLAASREYFEAKSTLFGEARAFLGSNTYAKIAKIATLKDRSQALDFCDTVLMILERSFYTKNDKTLTREIERVLSAREAVAQNASPRLQLLKAVV